MAAVSEIYNPPEPQLGIVRFSLLAIMVGIITGLGAILFRLLISLIHNLLFYGELSLFYDSEKLAPLSSWGPFVVLVPVAGGLVVVWLTRTFAPEARGHGVPEVMDAIYHQEGRIRPVVAVAKSFASAISIGSGAAVGREGPIIQIGASFGSTIAQLLGIAVWQRITLIAAGAGAGIAATFNTPLGGVMFAVELMLPEVSSRTFLPVVLATATATFIGRLWFGVEPPFLVPSPPFDEVTVTSLISMGGFALLGVLCGLTSFAFIRLLTVLEYRFEHIRNDYIRHVSGMFVVGFMMLGFAHFYGNYYISGTSYGAITEILHGNISTISLLLLLFAAKLLATTISLASGASGGIFSPSVFFGTTLGAAFGGALVALWPEVGFNPIEFAMVGMAAVVGGATGAAMTAIVMVFEMTRDYVIIVPMVVAVALSIGIRRWCSKENIYTIKLAWRGKFIPKERHTNMFLVRHAEEVMDARVVQLPGEMPLREALDHVGRDTDRRYVLVTTGGEIVKILPTGLLLRAEQTLPGDAPLQRVAAPPHTVVQKDDILHDVLRELAQANAVHSLVVTNIARGTDPGAAMGVVDREHIAERVMEHFRG